MTNKFLLYDLSHGSFRNEPGLYVGNSMEKADIYSEETAARFNINEKEWLQIPLTQAYVDSLPFDLHDTAPDTPHSKTMNPAEALKGDFIVLTEEGFMDEKYNSSTESSRPKVRGFELDYANLYSMEKLEKTGTEWIVEGDCIIVPVSKVQQAELAKLDAFNPEKEPHGFFMEPIGDNPKENLSDLGDALNELSEDAEMKL